MVTTHLRWRSTAMAATCRMPGGGIKGISMKTLLIALIIYTGADRPVRGAWVDVQGMIRDEFYVENTTDSRGVFVVEVEPGRHLVTVTKQGYQTFVGERLFEAKTPNIAVRLEPLATLYEEYDDKTQ